MMKEYKVLLLTEDEGILTVTINRPKALNALNDSFFKELIQLFNQDIDPDKYKGIIITGSGDRAFAAGADIKEFMSLDRSSAMAMSKRGQIIFSKIENFQVPVIAAVNGFALGGGCELAMACHMRIGHSKSKFGQPEVNLGILPGYGGTQRLAHLIGKSKAMELILTGDMIDGEEALKLGLLNHLCDPNEMIEKAKSIINKIALKAPLAVSESINAVNAVFSSSSNGYQVENDAFGKLAETDDFVEGASAFIEKRKAQWKGK